MQLVKVLNREGDGLMTLIRTLNGPGFILRSSKCWRGGQFKKVGFAVISLCLGGLLS